MTRWPKILLALAALAVAFLPSAAAAEGQLRCDDKFVSAAGEMDLCTFTNPRADGTEIRILLLGIDSNRRRISITFDKTQTADFVRLWRQARDKQSGSWQRVGDYNETGTDDNSHLILSAGPGVRFVIESPKLGANTLDLSPAELARFTSALERAVSYVAGSA